MSEGPGGPQGATAGGTLAMRMLSQQAMVASQMKRAGWAMKFSIKVFWGHWQGPCWGR